MRDSVADQSVHSTTAGMNALEDPGARYRILAELSSDAIVIRQDGCFAYVNAATLRLLGLRTDVDLLGRRIRDFIHPDDLAAALESQRRLDELRETAVPAEFRLRRADGTYVAIEALASPTEFNGREAAQAIWRDLSAGKATEKALREGEERFQLFMNNAPAVAWTKDAQLRWLYASRPYERSLGKSVPSLLGRDDFEVWPESVARQLRKTDERVLRTLAPLTFTQTVPDASGSDSHWLVVKFPVPDAAGGYGVGGMGIDVTERYRLEQALQDHEARMHLAMEAAQMGHWSWNAADRRVSLSDTMGPLLGLKRGTQLPHYEDWIAVIHPQDRKPFLAALAKSFRSDIALHHDCRMLKPNGEVLWMLTRGRAAYDVDGRRAGLVGVTLDISPRKEAESKLQAYAVQVRQLLYRLVDAQEAERRNLASALHDLIGQNLTALNIGMDILKRELPADAGTRAAPRLESMDAIMAETVDAVRDVMAQLHSPVLEDYGLVSALHWYAERFQERTGLSTTIDALDPFPRLGRNVELALYRIAQEALVNAARHSGASGVVVRVAREANRIRLAVEDDGRGFSDPAGARSARRGGWGLPEMRERAEAVGGTLHVQFPAAGGTRVLVELAAPSAD